MNRRLLAVCLSVVALAGSVAPVSASGPTYSGKMKHVLCQGYGGPAGYGQIGAKGHFSESGGTGTTYFTLTASVQVFNPTSGFQAYSADTTLTSSTFPAKASGHTANLKYLYSFLYPAAGNTYRLMFKYQFWSKKTGPAKLLKTIKQGGPGCYF